jgi:hypothetical protein
MPYQIAKQGKQLPCGHTRSVGHSPTRSQAQSSVRARSAATHGRSICAIVEGVRADG